MGKMRDSNKKNDDMRGLHLRQKLSLYDKISNTIMSEKIAIAVLWILFIFLLIWLLGMLS